MTAAPFALPSSNGRPALGVGETEGAHPQWCARNHRCTAERLPDGEHASRPEIWATAAGRIVAIRYRSRDGRHDHLQVTVSAALDPADETSAQSHARAVITTVYAAIVQLGEPKTVTAQANPTILEGHLR